MLLTEAVRVFKATQPALDAIKEQEKLNAAARKVIVAHMRGKDLQVYRGILLSEVPFTNWDGDKLRVELGQRIEDFRTESVRSYLKLLPPARAARTPAEPAA